MPVWDGMLAIWSRRAEQLDHQRKNDKTEKKQRDGGDGIERELLSAGFGNFVGRLIGAWNWRGSHRFARQLGIAP